MNTTSTRSSPPNADILSQHDANVQKRFRRALLCSLVVNVVALGAFALSKTAPIAEIEAAQTPMQWTISTTSRSFSMPDANTSSTRTANNASGERISRAVFRSSPRRENLQRESSRAENTSFETRRNTEPRDKYRAPRRVLMPENRGETKTSSQNALSAREQNTTVSGAVENRYPLEHSDHSPHNFPTMTSRTRSRASRNTTSFNAHASSAGNGSSSAHSQNAGLIRGALNTNDNSSSNNATSDFSRSSSGKVQSDKSSQNAPPQNARDESSRESSTRGREPETVSQDEPRIEKPRAELETPRKIEPERAPVAPPIERKREERIVEKRKREVREAEVVSQQKVKIPRRLRRDKRRASVRVEFDVDERGEAKARVAESSGDKDLDEVVLKAARKTRFKPRVEDGVATKTTKKMRYDINVDDGDRSDNDDED